MIKIFKYFMLIMIAVAAVSCSKDNEPDPNGGDIVGTWVCKNIVDGVSFTMCFQNDGTGWMEWSDEDGREDFEYTAKNGTIYFEGWGDSWECTYTISGKKLTIYGNPWGEEDDIDVITFKKK